MRIEIEWNVGDDEGDFPPLPEETPTAAAFTAPSLTLRTWFKANPFPLLRLAQGQSVGLGWRRLGLILAALVVLVAAGTIIVRGILESGERRLEASLRDTVALEIAAIRSADRELFFSLQDPTDSAWVAAQESLFSSFQQSGIVPYEIIQIKMVGEHAWVDVRLTIPVWGEVQQTWAYRRVENAWQHTRLEESWWGPRTLLVSDPVRVLYFARDEAAAHDLLGHALHWLYRACNDFGCNGLPTVTIDITHSLSLPPDSITWVRLDLLSFPSPHAGRGRPGGLAPEGLVARLARELARKAIYSQLGLGLSGPVLQPGAASLYMVLAEQAADWALNQWGLGPAPPPSNYVATLAAQYGPSAVRRLIAALGQNDSVEGALTQALGTSLAVLDHSADFFLFLLNVEAQAITRRDQATFQALQDPNVPGWGRLQLNRYDQAEVWWAVDGEIVDRIRRRATRDRILVMRVEWAGPRGRMQRLESFRWAGNRWLHTWPALEAWGEPIGQTDGIFRIVYYERDAELVRPIIPRLNGLVARIASDLGQPVPARPLTITISPVALGYQGLPDVVLPSPWASGLPLGEGPDAHSDFLLRQIMALMVHSLAWKDVPAEMTPGQKAALSAVVEWEVRSVLGEPLLDAEARAALGQALASGQLLPPDILWTTPVIVRPSFGQPETLAWPLARAEWLTLIDTLIQGQPQRLAALRVRLLAARSIEDWLQRSLGLNLAEVEAGWRAALGHYGSAR